MNHYQKLSAAAIVKHMRDAIKSIEDGMNPASAIARLSSKAQDSYVNALINNDMSLIECYLKGSYELGMHTIRDERLTTAMENINTAYRELVSNG